MQDQVNLAKSFWGGRLSLPFIDPILLSAWLTCFGLLCICLINLKKNLEFFIYNTLLLLCAVIFIYIALLTKSRTGWAAIPLVIALQLFRPSKNSINFSYLFVLSLCILYFASTIDSFPERIHQAISEFDNFRKGSFIESSVGIRLEMGLLALKAFQFSPIFGWGEDLFQTPQIQPYLKSHFSTSTLFLSQYAGFHNDLYAAMVRSGLLGIFGYFFTFLIPLIVFIYFLTKKNADSKIIAINGIAVSVTCIISSMTAEILAYKYSVTIFSYLISGLLAQGLCVNQRAIYKN